MLTKIRNFFCESIYVYNMVVVSQEDKAQIAQALGSGYEPFAVSQEYQTEKETGKIMKLNGINQPKLQTFVWLRQRLTLAQAKLQAEAALAQGKQDA